MTDFDIKSLEQFDEYFPKEIAQQVCELLKEATVAYDKGQPFMDDQTWDNLYFKLINWVNVHPNELEDTFLDEIYLFYEVKEDDFETLSKELKELTKNEIQIDILEKCVKYL